MKRFEFRLDRVLEWRRTQLEIELAHLGALTGEALALDRRRGQVQADYVAAERSLISSASVEAGELAALDRYRVWSRQESARLLARRAEWDQKISAQREKVIEARRAGRLLERLKEKRRAEWTVEFDREIENLAGELYLARRTSSPARSS
jgi:hypothetical protein